MNDSLEHYGVKGMKWGVRKDRSSGSNSSRKLTVSPSRLGGLKVSGDATRKPHGDAISAAKAKAIANKSSVSALSNKELKDLVNRMRLESQYSELKAKDKKSGQKFVEDWIKFAKSDVGRIAIGYGVENYVAPMFPAVGNVLKPLFK